MYEYIIGSLEEENPDCVVVECQKIGYKIKVSTHTLNELPKTKEEVRLFIHQVIRDDEISLYGFNTSSDRELFRTLIGISGIGPKVANGILSQFTRNDLITHILNNDPKNIAKAPGIGVKTANRIILELKDRFKDFVPEESDMLISATSNDLFNEAIDGLMGLGFNYAEANAMIKKAYTPEIPLEELIAQALRGSSPSKGR